MRFRAQCQARGCGHEWVHEGQWPTECPLCRSRNINFVRFEGSTLHDQPPLVSTLDRATEFVLQQRDRIREQAFTEAADYVMMHGCTRPTGGRACCEITAEHVRYMWRKDVRDVDERDRNLRALAEVRAGALALTYAREAVQVAQQSEQLMRLQWDAEAKATAAARAEVEALKAKILLLEAQVKVAAEKQGAE